MGRPRAAVRVSRARPAQGRLALGRGVLQGVRGRVREHVPERGGTPSASNSSVRAARPRS